MDFSTFAGILAAVGLILMGIGFSNVANFWDLQSFLIVVGGTFAALIASYPFKMLLKLPAHFKVILGTEKYNPVEWIDKITEYAMMARKNGLLVLEEKANEEKNAFFKDGILLIVDAIDADKAKARLEGDLEAIGARHEECIGFYERGASLAPAFGMIGTLVGLVNMLKNMNLDGGSGGSTIGQDMSVALITTLYGSFVANAIFTPIAAKLRYRNEEELLCKQLIIDGILAIQAGENPKYIKEKLLTYLAQKTRSKIADSSGGGDEGAAE